MSGERMTRLLMGISNMTSGLKMADEIALRERERARAVNFNGKNVCSLVVITCTCFQPPITSMWKCIHAELVIR